jgi:hypothetical protein
VGSGGITAKGLHVEKFIKKQVRISDVRGLTGRGRQNAGMNRRANILTGDWGNMSQVIGEIFRMREVTHENKSLTTHKS